MADLLIKGMKKLKAGQMLQVAENWNGALYVRETTKGEWCPLVEVPTHGRLIDENDFFSDDIIYPDKQFKKAMKDFVSDMPTVIEASDSNALNALDKEEE